MSMKEITLAEALLLRKELNEKIARMRPIQENAERLFVSRVKRQNINESTDNVTAHVPRITADQVDAYFNHLSRRLRLIDMVIQRANHMTNVEVDASVLEDFKGELPKDTHENAVDTAS